MLLEALRALAAQVHLPPLAPIPGAHTVSFPLAPTVIHIFSSNRVCSQRPSCQRCPGLTLTESPCGPRWLGLELRLCPKTQNLNQISNGSRRGCRRHANKGLQRALSVFVCRERKCSARIPGANAGLEYGTDRLELGRFWIPGAPGGASPAC